MYKRQQLDPPVLESFVSCAERPMATACNAIGCVKQVNLSVGVLYMLDVYKRQGLGNAKAL